MARRKQKILSDGSDSGSESDDGSDIDFDSQEDEDSRAERRLFERRQRKRPRTGRSGKQAAWEGIFGEDEGNFGKRFGGGIGSRQVSSKGGSSRNDWTKAPTFVSGSRKQADQSTDPDRPRSDKGSVDNASDADSDSAEQSGDEDESDGSDDTRPPSPRIRRPEDEEEEGASRGMGFGGMKSAHSGLRAASFLSKGSDAGPPADTTDDQPSAFGKRASAFRDTVSQLGASGRSNFQASRSSTPTPAAPKPADLSKADRAHLTKASESYGAKYLQKFGYAFGKGLGVREDGRAVPIAVGMLRRGEGIKSGIRTEDSKREARRKGNLADEVDATEPKRGKGRGNRQAVSDGWKKHKQVKVKVEHKTYEQLIAEDDTTRAGIGLVVDARGGELKAVESLSELSISGWTPTSETGQLRELRHNLRIILDITRGDVGNLVKDGKAVDERRRWALREEERSRTKKDHATDTLDRLRQVRSLISEISSLSSGAAKSNTHSLEPFAGPFNELLTNFKDEYKRLSLDDVIVGAIDTVLQSTFTTWLPFDVSSDALLSTLKPWREAFNLAAGDVPHESEQDREMTAWESFLWHRWLPKVRSTINNEWSPKDAWPAVHLVESWDPLLPDFIRDNVLRQLILPKVMAAVESWTGRANNEGSLASLIFPWLPLLGERHGQVLEEGKRRIRSLLRRWKPSDGVPAELARWRNDIFTAREWDTLIADHILGKLGSVLRSLVINPRDQDTSPIVNVVMPWHSLIRPSNFTRLFELEFFPKWLDVLYLWLVHPGYNGEEVAQWFEMWKRLFPPEVLGHKAIAHGFETGVMLMGQALSLGPSASQDLQRPSYSPLSRASKASAVTTEATSAPAPKRSARQDDITFRSIAEDYISSKDLLMVPLGKSHPSTGKPLLRVGKSIDGKGGVTVYVGEDAVFAQGDDGVFRAVALDDIVLRAGGGQ